MANPLQCSCLENPRDRGAWWAAIYGVAQSQIQLKQLSNSSNIEGGFFFYHCTTWEAPYSLLLLLLLSRFSRI